MRDFHRHPTANREFQSLCVCRDCAGLHGHVRVDGNTREQFCGCRRGSQSRWPRYDFNEAVTLCHGCATVPLSSGSRWSNWFCSWCQKRACRVNDLCSAYVIPIGRHSLMGATWQSGLMVAGVPPDIKAFAEGLAGVFDRIGIVNDHREAAVQANCREAALARESPPLADYLGEVSRDFLMRDRRLRGLLDRFNIPQSVRDQVGSDGSN